MRRASACQWIAGWTAVIAATTTALARQPFVVAPVPQVVDVASEVVEGDEVELEVETDPLVDAESHPAPAGVAGGFLGMGLRAMFNAIAPVPEPAQEPIPADEAADGEMPKDPAQAQRWQQRKQIRQQAKHLEQLFQPVLRTELEMVRQACPNLAAEARRSGIYRNFVSLFEACDVLLAPAASVMPWPNTTADVTEIDGRPLATVIVWGLVSSVILTLFVVPVLCRLVLPKSTSPGSSTAAGDTRDASAAGL